MPETAQRLTHCPVCRYDLTGLPPNHRCPECEFEYEENMQAWDEKRHSPYMRKITETLVVISFSVGVVNFFRGWSLAESFLIIAAPAAILVFGLTLLRPAPRNFVVIARHGVILGNQQGITFNIPWSELSFPYGDRDAYFRADGKLKDMTALINKMGLRRDREIVSLIHDMWRRHTSASSELGA